MILLSSNHAGEEDFSGDPKRDPLLSGREAAEIMA